jgi:hypothetical protein
LTVGGSGAADGVEYANIGDVDWAYRKSVGSVKL